MALNPNTLSVEKTQLHRPPLDEIAKVFAKGLKTNFAEVTVEVVECPDLTKKPFTLASKGLDGNPKLLEVGGVPYLIPLAKREKVYDIRDLTKLCESNPAFVIGAAAGPYAYAGVNCEGMINLNIVNGTVEQQTRISKVVGQDEQCLQEILPNEETRITLLANLFLSEGKPGKVIKVHVKKRIGSKNFIETLRNSIEDEYKEKLVGIGGTFIILEGKAKQHVMREFSKTPLENREQMENWLKFYNMSAPLIAFGTFVSNDGGDLDLRVQHFHSFSYHGEAGHYHNDTTPEIVEYLGYFNTGAELYRIDKPLITHKISVD